MCTQLCISSESESQFIALHRKVKRAIESRNNDINSHTEQDYHIVFSILLEFFEMNNHVIGYIEDTPLNKGLTYSSILLVAVLLLEVATIVVSEFKQNVAHVQKSKEDRIYSARVNCCLLLAISGILMILGTKIKMGFTLVLTKSDDIILALSAGTILLGYTLFMHQRAKVLLGNNEIKSLIRVLIVVVFVSNIAASICKYYNLKLTGNISLVNLFYGIMGLSAFGFDILFTRIFVKQIRQLNVVLQVKDEELTFIAKVGLAMIAASVITLVFFCSTIPFSTTSQMNLLLSHLTYQAEAMAVHIYFYARFIRTNRRREPKSRNGSRTHMRNTGRNESIDSPRTETASV